MSFLGLNVLTKSCKVGGTSYTATAKCSRTLKQADFYVSANLSDSAQFFSNPSMVQKPCWSSERVRRSRKTFSTTWPPPALSPVAGDDSTKTMALVVTVFGIVNYKYLDALM